MEDTWRQTSPLLGEELVCPGHITSAREAQGCPLSPSSFPQQARCLGCGHLGHGAGPSVIVLKHALLLSEDFSRLVLFVKMGVISIPLL